MVGTGIGGHQSSRSKTDTWLTPRYLIDALGGYESFDLDPCAAIDQPWPTAKQHYTERDNGLLLPWFGRVWCNPPYNRGIIGSFMGRMAQHGNGISLVFARSETEFFHRYVWPVADGIFFFEGRITFHRHDGSVPEWDGGAPSVLISYGDDNTDALAGCGLPGHFVPLRWRVFVAGYEAATTWARVVLDAMREIGEAASLADIYREIAVHPKAKRNRHWQEKVRQQLQRGPFERVGRGEWRLI
jgi:hypothetical protein